MSRSNAIYKESYNRGLDIVLRLGVDARLPSEVELSDMLGISRTTVRAVLTHLDETDIIDWTGRTKTVRRKPTKADYFSAEETLSASERVETQFMEYILGGDLKPGAVLRESELVREFGASTSVVREFLIRFSRFGLIQKEPNRHWVLRGFTREFAIELFDVREMFELRAFGKVVEQGAQGAVRATLLGLEADHLHIVDNIETEFLNFPRLDEQFHRGLISGLDNRFVDDFFGLVSVVFHYHYRWNKEDEKERNLNATLQHLRVIGALRAGEFAKARNAFEFHLKDARSTLLKSVPWET